MVLPDFRKWVIFKWEELAPPLGSKFFPFKVDPFLKGPGVQEATKAASLVRKTAENLPVVLSPLDPFNLAD